MEEGASFPCLAPTSSFLWAEGKKKPLSRNKKQRWEYEKLYQKEKINSLYLRYSESKSDEALANLIEACSPIIDVILSTRYRRHCFRYRNDLQQEIRLKLWENLGRRTEEKLQSKRYTINPSAYLFFLIRAYAFKAFKKFQKIYKEQEEMSFGELEKMGAEMSGDD